MKTNARMEWGGWLAPCPRPGCTSAMLIDLGQRLFSCGGRGGCNAVAEIVWPLDADEIVRVVDARPLAINRNWLPGETVSDLVAENREHGVH